MCSQKLNNKVEQQWYIKLGATKIQLANTTLCLDGGPKSKNHIQVFEEETKSNTTCKANWKDMGNIYLKNCSDTEVAQNWTALTDGRIALTSSTSPRTYRREALFSMC